MAIAKIDKLLDVLEENNLPAEQKYARLYTGAKMPLIGLGTWKSKPGEVTAAVEYAIDVGYRHIDCAWIYGNESEVGIAIVNKIREGVVTREELFITSKLWNTFHHPDDVIPALEDSLSKLGLEYLDLYLIHHPLTFERGGAHFNGGGPALPRNEDGTVRYGEVYPHEDTWRQMEQVFDMGLTKHIGLSNFNHKQCLNILTMCRVPPAVNQCESHPYLVQTKLSEFCKSNNIVFSAYSPLGSPDRPWSKPNDPSLLEDETLKMIADSKEKSVAQILIRYQVERGFPVLPKSVTPSRILENFSIWDFSLNENEIRTIESFDLNFRFCVPLVTLEDGTTVARDRNHPFFAWNEEY